MYTAFFVLHQVINENQPFLKKLKTAPYTDLSEILSYIYKASSKHFRTKIMGNISKLQKQESKKC